MWASKTSPRGGPGVGGSRPLRYNAVHDRPRRLHRRPRPRPRAEGPRGRALPRRAPALRGAPRARPSGHAQRRADGLARRQLPPRAALGRRGQGRPLHRRRRPHLQRLQHRRHVDVLRLRAGAARAGRRAPHGARPSVPAADRGRDRRRRGAGAALRPAQVAVHALGLAGEHRGDPRGPGRDRTRQGAHVRRPLPRPLRPDAGRARRPTASRSPRSAACRGASSSRP